MARLPTTLDSFNAVAEPKRRRVLDMLARGECPVNRLVVNLGWPQPQVSKHLSVLLAVGLVNVRREGRERLYTINGSQLKPIHAWVGSFERFWEHQLHRIKARAETKEKQSSSKIEPKHTPKEH